MVAEPRVEPKPVASDLKGSASTATDNAISELKSPSKLKLAQMTNNELWVKQALQLPLRGMSKNILLQCIYLGQQASAIQLSIDPQYFDLLNDAHQQRINQALTEYFEQPVLAKITAGTSVLETPIGFQQRQQKERLQLARDALEQDPIVQAMVQQFEAVLDIDSIEPKD